MTFHRVPDSEYTVRLWPASPSHQMHCLDFVDTETTLPVNSPSDFELWTVLNVAPSTVEYQRVHSLENIHGYYSEAIVAGEEKFVVRDGMQYALCRPGKEVFFFNAPSTTQGQSL